MVDFLQTLITAITVGSLYALIALGYTMVYGILKFINFAHSDVFVLGAWSAFTIATFAMSRMGIPVGETPPLWFGGCVLLAAMLVCGGVGYVIERFAYRPLRRAPRLNVLITAIGVSLFLQNAGQLKWQITPDLKLPFGASPQKMPSLLSDRALNEESLATGALQLGDVPGTVKLASAVDFDPQRAYRIDVTATNGKSQTFNVLAPEQPGAAAVIDVIPLIDPGFAKGAQFALLRMPQVAIQLVDVVITLSAIVLMLALEVLIFRTKFGMAMRAVSFNTDTAALMGIPVDRVISTTFVTGAMLAAAAGFLYALKYPGLNQPAHEVWVLLGLKAFVAAVVGGIGNVRGAVLGGFLIAFIEFFGMKYISTDLRDIYVFAVLILVLLVKPSGLLGSTVREKV